MNQDMVYLAALQVCITARFWIIRICAVVQFLVLKSLRKRLAVFQLSLIFDQNLILLWKTILTEMLNKIYQLLYTFSVEYLSG